VVEDGIKVEANLCPSRYGDQAKGNNNDEMPQFHELSILRVPEPETKKETKTGVVQRSYVQFIRSIA
jgi:hypothetical protein